MINRKLMGILKIAFVVSSGIFIAGRFSGPGDATGSDLLPTLTLDSQEDMSEECMDQLEEIRELITDNDLDDLDDIDYYICPLHNKPYVVTVEGSTVIVSDPDPQLHGFRSMSVSNKNPGLILVE